MKLAIPSPFGIPWPLIGCVAAAALVLLLLYFFGNAQYERGKAEERASNAEAIAAIQTNALAAVREEAAAFRSRSRAIDVALAESHEALETVPHDASDLDFLIVWAHADRRLLAHATSGGDTGA